MEPEGRTLSKIENFRLGPAILLLAFMLICLEQAPLRSLYSDEAFSVVTASGLGNGDWQLLHHDVHPPLYFLALSLWVKLFGVGEAGVRSLSIIFLMGGALAWYLGFRRAAGAGPAWWALLLFVLNPVMIYFGQFVRMYGLLVALEGLMFLFAVLLLERPKAAWAAGLAVAAAAAIYTQYLAGVIWAGIFGAGLALAWKQKQRPSLWIGAAAAAAAAFMPWIPFFLEHRQNISLMKLHHILPFGIRDLSRIFELLNPFAHLSGPAGYAGLIFAAAAAGIGAYELVFKRSRLTLLFLPGAGLGVLVFLALISWTQPIINDRSLVIVVPFLLGLAGLGLNRLPPLPRSLVLVLFAVAWLAGFPRLAQYNSTDDFREASAWLAAKFRADDILLVSINIAEYNLLPLHYYGNLNGLANKFTRDNFFYPAKGSDRLPNQDRYRGRTWYFLETENTRDSETAAAFWKQGFLAGDSYEQGGVIITGFRKPEVGGG